tara:strand:+ start:307 stop:546 length:240 start_codon:yes stop_codon:yes gene_type:complete
MTFFQFTNNYNAEWPISDCDANAVFGELDKDGNMIGEVLRGWYRDEAHLKEYFPDCHNVSVIKSLSAHEIMEMKKSAAQ